MGDNKQINTALELGKGKTKITGTKEPADGVGEADQLISGRKKQKSKDERLIVENK
jgi:hypothetical protein